jgi:hypothetical protein
MAGVMVLRVADSADATASSDAHGYAYAAGDTAAAAGAHVQADSSSHAASETVGLNGSASAVGEAEASYSGHAVSSGPSGQTVASGSVEAYAYDAESLTSQFLSPLSAELDFSGLDQTQRSAHAFSSGDGAAWTTGDAQAQAEASAEINYAFAIARGFDGSIKVSYDAQAANSPVVYQVELLNAVGDVLARWTVGADGGDGDFGSGNLPSGDYSLVVMADGSVATGNFSGPSHGNFSGSSHAEFDVSLAASPAWLI